MRVHFFNRFFRGDRVKITFENGHVEYGSFHEIVNERDFHGGRFKIDGTKDLFTLNASELNSTTIVEREE